MQPVWSQTHSTCDNLSWASRERPSLHLFVCLKIYLCISLELKEKSCQSSISLWLHLLKMTHGWEMSTWDFAPNCWITGYWWALGEEKPLSPAVYLLMASPDFQGRSHTDVPDKPRGTQTKQKDMSWGDKEERQKVYVGGSRWEEVGVRWIHYTHV